MSHCIKILQKIKKLTNNERDFLYNMEFYMLLAMTLALAAFVGGISREIQITHGLFLNDNIYGRFTVPTIYQCVEVCSASTLCTSINFRQDTKECFLNRDEPLKPLFKNNKYSHIYLRDAPETLKLSADVRCPPQTWFIPGNGNGTCIPERDTCLDINIYCGKWRDKGQCVKTGSFNFTKYHCRQSCNTCHLPSPFS